MSNLRSLGFNQKNFNGTRPVTNTAINLGTTRGKGSSTRMFNYCTQHSEAPSLCINSFITISAATPAVNEDILFNISTFSNLFNYDGSGTPKKLPSKYINALTSAANRWNQFIKFNQDTINLIRNVETNNKNWNGIELKNVTYINTPTPAASVKTTTIGYTTLNVSFTLEINDILIGGGNDSFLSDVFTHELGHVLGFSNWSSRVDGKEGGAILLPYLVTNERFYFDPSCTINPPYKNMNVGYNNYWGTIDWLNRKVEAQTTPIINDSKGFHLTGYFISIEPPPQPSTKGGKYLKRGFGNEIMVKTFTSGKYYISQVSLGYLLDLFTNWRGSNYFNYTLKNSNSEANPAIAGSFNIPQPGGDWDYDSYIYFNKSKQIKSINLNSNDTKEKDVEEIQTITFNCSCNCSPTIIPLEL